MTDKVVYKGKRTVEQLGNEIDELSHRVGKHEEIMETVHTVKTLLNKWGAVLLGAALTAGLINGTAAKFLSAILSAMATAPHIG